PSVTHHQSLSPPPHNAAHWHDRSPVAFSLHFPACVIGGTTMPDTSKLSRRPLYMQVCDELIKRMTDGHWKPGSLLPNEIDLARELDVSPGTMRKALDVLEADKLVERRQGHGTVVTDND